MDIQKWQFVSFFLLACKLQRWMKVVELCQKVFVVFFDFQSKGVIHISVVQQYVRSVINVQAFLLRSNKDISQNRS